MTSSSSQSNLTQTKQFYCLCNQCTPHDPLIGKWVSKSTKNNHRKTIELNLKQKCQEQDLMSSLDPNQQAINKEIADLEQELERCDKGLRTREVEGRKSNLQRQRQPVFDAPMEAGLASAGNPGGDGMDIDQIGDQDQDQDEEMPQLDDYPEDFGAQEDDEREGENNLGGGDDLMDEDEEDPEAIMKAAEAAYEEEIREAAVFLNELRKEEIQRLVPGAAPEPQRNDPPPPSILEKLTEIQRRSLLWFAKATRFNNSQEQWREDMKILGEAGTPILSHYVTRKLSRQLVELEVMNEKRCKNGCRAFVGLDKQQERCNFCNSSEKSDFPTLSLIPRIRQMLLHAPSAKHLQDQSELSQKLQEAGLYSSKSPLTGEIGKLQSTLENLLGGGEGPVWNSDHSSPNSRLDIPLSFGTDGAQFLSGALNTSAWILIVQILGLPANLRALKNNLFLLAQIPGEPNLKDIHSYFEPFFKDMARLGEGVQMWDANRKAWRLVRCHIVWISADTLGMTKCMHHIGHNGLHPCKICGLISIRGSVSNSLYMPVDRSKFKDKDGEPLEDVNPDLLPLYTIIDLVEFIKEYKRLQSEINVLGNKKKLKDLTTETGLKGIPPFYFSKAFNFPLSFTLDCFHIFFLNVYKLIWELLIGKKQTKKSKEEAAKMARAAADLAAAEGARADLADLDDEEENGEDERIRFQGEDVDLDIEGIELGREGDPRKLSAAEQQQLATMVEVGYAYLPGGLITAKPRSIYAFFNTSFKMHEFATIFHFFLLPFLNQLSDFDQEVIDMIAILIKAVGKVMGKETFTQEETDKVQAEFTEFVRRFESIYIRGDPALIHRARPILHSLLHIGYFIENWGSVRAAWVAFLEREIGYFGRTLRNFKHLSAHMDQNIADREAISLFNIALNGVDGLGNNPPPPPFVSRCFNKFSSAYVYSCPWLEGWQKEKIGGVDEIGMLELLEKAGFYERRLGNYLPSDLTCWGSCSWSEKRKLQGEEMRKVSEEWMKTGYAVRLGKSEDTSGHWIGQIEFFVQVGELTLDEDDFDEDEEQPDQLPIFVIVRHYDLEEPIDEGECLAGTIGNRLSIQPLDMIRELYGKVQAVENVELFDENARTIFVNKLTCLNDLNNDLNR